MNHTHTDALVQLTRKRGMSEAAFTEMIERLGRRRAEVLAAGEEVGRYAETLADSVFTDGQSVMPDCQACGACCAYFHQVAVLDTDPTPRRLTWAVWDAEDAAGPKTRWLRREAQEGRCAAFSGRVGQDARCEIYELRPRSCRAFEAGSDRCRAVRRAYGLEPPLSPIEQAERAGRTEPDAGGEWNQVESLERRDALSFSEQERTRLLGEMIAYNQARLGDILAEAQRLQALLAEKGIAPAAAIAARQVNAINEEARAAALARLPVTECAAPCEGVGRERLDRALLDVAAQSQTALERASRWLLALGELVFAAFEMRVEMA